MRRIDVYDPETGEVRHPLLVPREEKNVSAGRGLRRQGFRRRVQLEHHQGCDAVHHRQNGEQGRNVDIETIGRKARDLFRRRYPAARVTRDAAEDDQQPASEQLEGMSLGASWKTSRWCVIAGNGPRRSK